MAGIQALHNAARALHSIKMMGGKVLSGKGRFPKQKRGGSSADSGVVKVQNPLQQDLRLDDSDSDDEALSASVHAGDAGNKPKSAQSPPGSGAKKAKSSHHLPDFHIADTLHHMEEVVIKDMHIVEDELKRDLKQLEKLVPDDMKLVAGVSAHLAGASAVAAAESAKAVSGMGLSATMALGDALLGKELAKVERTFRRVDVDGSGFLEPDEVKLLLHQLGKDVTDTFIESIMKVMDPDGDGEVSLEEFKDWWVSEGFNQSLLGDSVGMLKDMTATPILIFYHLFDESPEWFATLGDAGIPLAHLSNIITWALNILQVVWSAAAVGETVRSMSADPNRNPETWEFWAIVWWWINMVCAVLFLCEWLCKCVGAVASGNLKRFLSDKMSYIDLLTNLSGLSIVFGMKVDLASYSITFAASGTQIDFRWLRIVRLSRVLKTIQNERINNLAPVVWQILESSTIALMVPSFVLIIMVQVCASLFYYWESPVSITCELPSGERISNWVPTIEMNPGCMTEYTCQCAGTEIYLHNNLITGEIFELKAKQAENIFDAWWWALVTVTTVGYGDVAPITALGQVLGACTGFVGLLIVAMPITIVGKSFHDAHEEMLDRIAKVERAKAEKKALRAKMKQQKKERAELKRKGLLVKAKSVDRSRSADAKLARNADMYAGERQDVLLHLSLVSEKLQKLEADLADSTEQSPTTGQRSEIGQLCDAIATIRTQVVEVWPAERVEAVVSESQAMPDTAGTESLDDTE